MVPPSEVPALTCLKLRSLITLNLIKKRSLRKILIRARTDEVKKLYWFVLVEKLLVWKCSLSSGTYSTRMYTVYTGFLWGKRYWQSRKEKVHTLAGSQQQVDGKVKNRIALNVHLRNISNYLMLYCTIKNKKETALDTASCFSLGSQSVLHFAERPEVQTSKCLQMLRSVKSLKSQTHHTIRRRQKKHRPVVRNVACQTCHLDLMLRRLDDNDAVATMVPPYVQVPQILCLKCLGSMDFDHSGVLAFNGSFSFK